MDHMGLHYGALDLILWAPTIISYKLEIDIYLTQELYYDTQELFYDTSGLYYNQRGH